MSSSLAPLILAFCVFPAYLLELFLPYPYLIEETFKFLVVFFLIGKIKDSYTRFKLAIFSGVLFSLSENLFYFSLASTRSGLSFILERLALTIPLHCLTLLLMASAVKNKTLLLLSLALSILMHYLFNFFLS